MYSSPLFPSISKHISQNNETFRLPACLLAEEKSNFALEESVGE
jgi:hypothetical protein